MEYASKGVAGAALGTGIAGLALGVLNGGLAGLGGNGLSRDININAPDVEVARLRGFGYGYGHGHGHGHFINQFEFSLGQQLAAKDAIIVDKESKLYTNQEIAKLQASFDAYKLETERRFCYDEKLILENTNAIQRVDDYGRCNYYKMKKSIDPRDICPPITPTNQSLTR